MYVIELALKLSAFPVTVQRKTLKEAESLYKQLSLCLEKGQPRIMELTCEKENEKKISILTSEIIAIQIYEKPSGIGGNKRPGFSVEA